MAKDGNVFDDARGSTITLEGIGAATQMLPKHPCRAH
jgi:hypothetical protein